MRAAAVVVVRVRKENATEMAFVADYDVIEALTANRTDHAFRHMHSAKVIAPR